MFEGEANRSTPRLSTPREEPLSRAEQKSRSTSHVHFWHSPSNTGRCYVQTDISHLPVQKESRERRLYECKCFSLFRSARTHFARFRTAHMRGNPDVHSSQNSALFSTKCCTTIANHAPVISRDWWEHSLEGGKELAWEKGAGKGRADYFKDRMWAGGSKHADSTWCEIYSRILAAWQSRWKRDFSLLKDISEN